MKNVAVTIHWVIWEMQSRIDKLIEGERLAIDSGDYALAERLRIRREEYQSFKFHIEEKRDKKHTVSLYDSLL